MRNPYIDRITGQAFQQHSLSVPDSPIPFGYWLSEAGCLAVPFIGNQVYFTEAEAFLGASSEDSFRKFSERQIEDQGRYESFVHHKSRRPTVDAYAAFQPFNEAVAAFLPFIDGLRQTLNPGDVIVDAWCRTGWSAIFLASTFPEQKIIALWEGDKDVLGYRGFLYWISRFDNIEVVFCDVEQGLPFADNSVSLIYGYDTLHRYEQSVLLPEVLRVAREDGAIVFPHVHLSNSEPEPFFERGCKQIHGNDYAKLFEHLLVRDSRQAFVFSEPGLFQLKKPEHCVSDPDTEDYNALVAILPKGLAAGLLDPEPFAKISPERLRLIINPLLSVDLHQQRIDIDPEHLNGVVGHLLERHPIYEAAIAPNQGYVLSELSAKVLYWSQREKTVAEIAEIVGVEASEIFDEIRPLIEQKAVQALPLEAEGGRFYQYLSTQEYREPDSKQTLRALWEAAQANFSSELLLINAADESAFTYADVAEVVEAMCSRFKQTGLSQGDTIVLYCALQAEAVMTYWAGIYYGITVVPLCPQTGWPVVEGIIEEVSPSLLFCDEAHYNRIVDFSAPIVVFDGEDEMSLSANDDYLSDWLDVEGPMETEMPVLRAEDPAVILYTSGTTGRPKGVVLSHGNLYRSGRLVTEGFHWESSDRYLALGNLDTMSGLRNTAIAPLGAGASIVIPNGEAHGNPFALAEQIRMNEITILSTNPPLLRSFEQHERRVQSDLVSLRMVLSTGSDLSEALIEAFSDKFNVPVYNYYGLTETTGICLSVTAGDESFRNRHLGKPVGCIAQIVDEAGALVPSGVVGELRIYSENLTSGYFKRPDDSANVIKDGWLYTGDLAKVNAGGDFSLTGRKRDIIKSTSGDLVYVAEVELFMRSLDAVADVAVCPHREGERERLVAFVVPKDSSVNEAALIDEIRQRFATDLDERKTPSFFRIHTALPYGNTGKVRKGELMNEFSISTNDSETTL